MNASDSHDRPAVPDFVPDEWVAHYGSRPVSDPRTGTAETRGRDTARSAGLGIALLIGTFVMTIAAVVLPAAGPLGLVGAAGAIAVVAAATTWLARRLIDGQVRQRSGRAPPPRHRGRRAAWLLDPYRRCRQFTHR